MANKRRKKPIQRYNIFKGYPLKALKITATSGLQPNSFYAKITKCLLKLASPKSLNLPSVTPENEQTLAQVQQLELHLQFSMPWWLGIQPSLHFPSGTAPSGA